MKTAITILKGLIRLCTKILKWAEGLGSGKGDGKVVAFIDLLGFKNYILKGNPTSAYTLLNDFHSQLSTRIADSHLPRETVRRANEDLLGFLEMSHGVDSFEEFHPFSDSTFIASTHPDRFVLQLSTLLVDAFMYTGDAFDQEADADNITNVEVAFPAIDAEGHVEIHREKETRYPILLRGGIVLGDAVVAHIQGISQGNVMRNATLVGEGVIKAYELEQLHVKGPRMICDEAFAQRVQLREARRLVRRMWEGKHYEILWPSAHYFSATTEADIRARICTFVRRAANLWKAFSRFEFGVHYYCFLKLVIQSTLHAFRGTAWEQLAAVTLREEIARCSLTLHANDLIREY
jgi:hypothetical protein